MADKLLEIKGLKTYFYTSEGVSRAVDGVDLELVPGETLGLVGESGCGKTVTALSILRLIPEPPGKIVSGEILYNGVDLLKLPINKLRRIRGNDISMIFQEPMTALNPVFSIGNQISESIILHQELNRSEALEKTVELLKKVDIPAPEQRIREYPHQLSGGMRQRAMIAMALACNPRILIADEPTTALDVTIQAQILDLLTKLKEDFSTAVILITHDLGVVAETAQKVAVMYAGRIVESGATEDIFLRPQHPYTQGLLQSLPKLKTDREEGTGRERLTEIKGTVPSLFDLPPGCKFEPRCSYAMKVCREKEPQLKDTEQGHNASCWYVEKKIRNQKRETRNN
jgi:oligopeptide/dipeptide ABC transporter ATP-binding protein